MNIFIKITSFFLSLLVFYTAVPVFAAELFFEAKSHEFTLEEEFLVSFFLNTENEDINAIEGKIIFSEKLLELKEIKDGNSIISFWIERPKMTNEGKIEFSGIIPGGYKETNGFLFSAIFTAETKGKGTIEFRNVRALKNDGLGTPAEVKISNFQFNIYDVGLRKIGEVRLPEIEDKELPETFRPEIARDESIFEGRWFVVFATQDKASGIDHYEIKESRQRILSVFKKWSLSESPYVLRDQELRNYVWIKAVDKAGNERIAVVEPRYPMRWYENWWVWIIIILVIIFSFIVIKRNLWKKLLPH